MQSLAICVYGSSDPQWKSKKDETVTALTTLFAGKYQLDIFQDYTSTNSMQNLYRACWKKITQEVTLDRQYDFCMAVHILTDLIPRISLPLETEEMLYYYRGSFNSGYGNTVSPELFYCPSTSFNRACEYIKWSTPKTMMPWSQEVIQEPELNYNFAYFLKSWKISLRCMSMHDPELFRKH